MTSKVTVTTMESSDVRPSSRFNIGLHKIPSGLLKLMEAAVGATLIALCEKHGSSSPIHKFNLGYNFMGLLSGTFYACLITTFLLLITHAVSRSGATVLQKSFFELLYHSISSICFMIGGVEFLYSFLAKLPSFTEEDYNDPDFASDFKGGLAVSILGPVNGLLYLVSAYCNYHSFKSP